MRGRPVSWLEVPQSIVGVPCFPGIQRYGTWLLGCWDVSKGFRPERTLGLEGVKPETNDSTRVDTRGPARGGVHTQDRTTMQLEVALAR